MQRWRDGKGRGGGGGGDERVRGGSGGIWNRTRRPGKHNEYTLIMNVVNVIETGWLDKGTFDHRPSGEGGKRGGAGARGLAR